MIGFENCDTTIMAKKYFYQEIRRIQPSPFNYHLN